MTTTSRLNSCVPSRVFTWNQNFHIFRANLKYPSQRVEKDILVGIVRVWYGD